MKIACVMMQKNEDELLDKWLRHHGVLFGYENLFVFDNGSTINSLTQIINDYSSMGVNFLRDNKSPEDFEMKGLIIGEKISELENLNLHDYIIPLDCDEFVGVIREDGEISFEASDIYNELMNHINSSDVLMFRGQFFNSPLAKDRFIFRQDRKCFFRSGTFGSLDVGFHWGKSKLGSGEHRTLLIQFHFHNKPFEKIKEYASEKLKLRVKSFNKDDLEGYTGPGVHLIEYLLTNELNYYKKFLDPGYKKKKEIVEHFDKLKISWPYEKNISESRVVVECENNKESEIAFAAGLIVSDIYPEVFGHIDSIFEDHNLVRVSGWSFSQCFTPVENYRIIVDGVHLIRPKIVNIVSRGDVVKYYRGAPINCGFEVVIFKKDQNFDWINVRDLEIYSSIKADELGWLISSRASIQRWLEHRKF